MGNARVKWAGLVWLGVLLASLLTGCATEPLPGGPTLIPTELVPTVIAQTVEANLGGSATAAARTSMSTEKPAIEALNPGEAGSPTAVPGHSPASSPVPSVTLTPSQTPTPSRTPAPTRTPTITRTPTASLTPSITPNPVIPKAAIEITSPGQLSRVVSVIPVRALLFPGVDGRVILELLGEDGRLLVRDVRIMNPNLGRKVGLVADVEFEIPGVAELGRLQIRVEDAFGRVTAQNSVDLILLSDGPSDIYPAGDQLARVFIQFPEPNLQIEGGTLVVEGLARPLYGQPLVAELFTEQGKMVGMRVIEIPAEPADGHRPFVVDVPYTVSEPTRALLVIRERGVRILGTAYLESVPVVLKP